MPELPTQVEDIDLVEVADGFVVYHPQRDRVHFLNHTAAVVLTLCDGQRGDEEIVTLVQRCYELAQPPEAEVTACLRQLRTEGLVE